MFTAALSEFSIWVIIHQEKEDTNFAICITFLEI